MSDIRNESEYAARFTLEKCDQDSRRVKALESALDSRKFEIELYWRRAAYFWTLIVATFAAYFALHSSKNGESLIPLVTCLGFLLSLGWYLVNRGSKYWQENWERHVEALESEVIGPLYKTTLSLEEFHLLKFWKGYPYSVTKINQLISLFVVLVWLGLGMKAFLPMPWPECVLTVVPWALVGLTMTFAILLVTLGTSGRSPRRINFPESNLKSTSPTDKEA